MYFAKQDISSPKTGASSEWFNHLYAVVISRLLVILFSDSECRDYSRNGLQVPIIVPKFLIKAYVKLR